MVVPLARSDQDPARAVDDASIHHGPVEFPSGDGTIDGHLAHPKREGTFPGIVVIPGNWIIEPYIPEFAAQLAQAGFAALVVNVYHQFPEVKSWDEAQAVPWETTQKIIRESWTDEEMLQDVGAAFDHLRAQTFVSPKKLGITGFCGGGWNAILFAADQPQLVAAVVPFYAPPDAAKRFNRPRSVLDVLGELKRPFKPTTALATRTSAWRTSSASASPRPSCSHRARCTSTTPSTASWPTTATRNSRPTRRSRPSSVRWGSSTGTSADRRYVG
jgi:dienelactone hydrolase